MNKLHCYKCQHDYEPYSVRRCPHPAVNIKLGSHICVWCCKKCEFCKKSDIGYVCEYEKKKD